MNLKQFGLIETRP